MHRLSSGVFEWRGTQTVTEHDLNDPSEVAARRVAGQIDFVASLFIPTFYFIYVRIILSLGVHSDVTHTRDDVDGAGRVVHYGSP